ncbi:hypothetical protein OG233_06875 [Streptomyces sp. NBC_01218]|uniref:hypothetical protein n=1 Tax=Streptomyces sp. NBC_01218 TaxID=2903780 RepID=UPI002E0F2EBC|nr:hypothetical protein OG233_06875 [Streptomyces sp. NBC_01218]
MIRKARLPAPLRLGRFDAESIPGLVLLGMNATGLVLTGTLVTDEFDSNRGLATVSAPDPDQHAEEQPDDAANATASTHTYRYLRGGSSPAMDEGAR